MDLNHINKFIDSLSHDQIVRLDAALRFFLNEDSTQRDAYSSSLVDFDAKTNQTTEKRLEALFSLSGHDLFNNISNCD